MIGRFLVITPNGIDKNLSEKNSERPENQWIEPLDNKILWVISRYYGSRFR
jgi:hypothetical protein